MSREFDLGGPGVDGANGGANPVNGINGHPSAGPSIAVATLEEAANKMETQK